MRALKLTAIAVVTVAIVAALLAVAGVPSGLLVSAVKERVERATGYRLAVNGGATIALTPALSVTLRDVALQDPSDREINNRLTASSIRAELRLASLWSGKPEVTELAIVRPVLNVPLQRLRDPNPPPKPAPAGRAQADVDIRHVSVSGGTVVFANLHDRVEQRIETVYADVAIGSDRTLVITGNARAAAHPFQFEIKATAPASERQAMPTEFSLQAPDLVQGPATGRAEVRLNGTVLTINALAGKLGDGAFNGFASVDFASKPLVKLDLDFQRLALAAQSSRSGTGSQPWSNAPIDLTALNYVDAQARISSAELLIGDGRFAPVASEATLTNGVLKATLANVGAYEGSANGEITIDVSGATPAYALRTDITGVRALPLLKSLAGFDRLDGRMQAKIAVRSGGNSQRAIMANVSGTAFALFRDGAIRGLNLAQMLRALAAGTLSGWPQDATLSTDLSQLSASFKIDQGRAATSDLTLVGPLVKMTGAGTIDLANQQLGFRVEPKLVMTTEGQGRAGDPVGFGVPVVIEGPWDGPRIYPDIQGVLDDPDAAYAKLREIGKGLFGPGGLLGGDSNGQGSGDRSGQGQGSGGQGSSLGETLNNLIQQGLGGGLGDRGTRNGDSRKPPPSSPQPPAPPADSAPDSQPMNDVLRQLFNR